MFRYHYKQSNTQYKANKDLQSSQTILHYIVHMYQHYCKYHSHQYSYHRFLEHSGRNPPNISCIHWIDQFELNNSSKNQHYMVYKCFHRDRVQLHNQYIHFHPNMSDSIQDKVSIHQMVDNDSIHSHMTHNHQVNSSIQRIKDYT